MKNDDSILFQRYRVLRPLGRGGAGSVFLVEDTGEGGTQKALKTIDLPPGREEAFDMLRHEFEILARYDHPHLARAYEIGREGNQAYYTLQFVSETHLLDAAEGMDQAGILHLAVQVLKALAFIHHLGLVHGDVKPQNILVDLSGTAPHARLLDFGLAESILDPRGILPASAGTPAYMSPEKQVGAPPDPRSDLYSFGITLFQLLTGRLPFQAKSPGEILEMHRFSPPPSPRAFDPSIPLPLERICLRLMEKEARRRFPSAEMVIASLASSFPGMASEAQEREGGHLITAAFVGREASLAALESRIGPSLEGEAPPASAVVLGREGAGKSRLVREFALDARVKGYRVVEASCRSQPGGALAPLGEMLHSFTAEVASLEPHLREPVQRFLENSGSVGRAATASPTASRLEKGLRSLLASVTKTFPFLFVLDDVHLVQPGFLDRIRRLCGQEAEGKWGFLLAGRDRNLSPEIEHRFQSWKEGEPSAFIEMKPFSAVEVEHWVGAALPGAVLPEETAEEIVRWADGNPFLIREALLTHVESGRFVPSKEGWRFLPPEEGELTAPVGVQTERRLAFLSAEEREVLNGLALHPGPLEVGTLAVLFEGKEPPVVFSLLRGLARKGWVTEGMGGRAFSLVHDRLRRPILLGMGREERAEGHRRFAEILSPKGESDPVLLPVVAEHWARSGFHEQTAHWCHRAGRQGQDWYITKRGLRFLRAAKRAAVAAGWDEMKRSAIDLNLAGVTHRMGKPQLAESIFRELLGRDLPPQMKANVHFSLGMALAKQNRLTEAYASLEESRSILENAGDREHIPDVFAMSTQLLAELGRYEEVLALRPEIEALRRDRPGHYADALGALSMTLMDLGRPKEAESLILESIRIDRKKNQEFPRRPQYFVFMGYSRYLQGRMESSIRWFSAARRWYAREYVAYGQAISHCWMSFIAHLRGMPTRASEETRKAFRQSSKVGSLRMLLSLQGFQIPMLLASGRIGEAQATLRAMDEEIAPLSEDRDRFSFRRSVEHAGFLVSVGRSEEALQTLETIRPHLPKMQAMFKISWILHTMDALLESGKPREVLSLVGEVEADGGPLPMAEAEFLLAKGRAFGRLGRSREADEAFQEAEARCRAQGTPGRLAKCKRFEGEWALSSGAPERALASALEAVALGKAAGDHQVTWEALRLAGDALTVLGRERRAAKFYRRAAWILEGVLDAVPDSVRKDFERASGALAILGRAAALHAEATAVRLASVCAHGIEERGEDWGKTAAAWARACGGILGADAMVFHPGWTKAAAGEVHFGDPRASDETWNIAFGSGGTRPGSVTLYRRWGRGPFLPVARRVGSILGEHLAALLERGERDVLARRLDRVQRRMREKVLDMETALTTARKTLYRTQAVLAESRGFREIIGVSKGMKKVFEEVERWGPTGVTVLVTGENGTGKELVARAIHMASDRREGPFFAVNCAELADTLLASELFGFEKGAFTGAEEQRPGLFENAFGGTLVLDEVADMSPKMQGQILRALEEKKIRRLGASKSLPIHVRVIALSNRPLEKEVKAKRFREDLFHRLNSTMIELPPLRARTEDIPLLAEFFLEGFRKGEGKTRISRQVAAVLMRYRWPGNVRELRNMIQRASVLARGRALQPDDFPDLESRPLTKTSLNEGFLAKLRKAASQAGIPLESRHEDLFRLLKVGGRVRRVEYEQMAGISSRTATRDFNRFISLGLVRKTGRGKGTLYQLTDLAQRLA
ncbi:MAG: tetratricopeptide repeat protein [Planctomycetota bacterium]|jgi:DNA-binding NtrC family response regulator/tetratricopeptide (TPR) repeat protein